MSEILENTFTAYLGQEFQQRLMWQLLVEPEFAEKILPDLAVEYFDDPNLKRMFIIIWEYTKEYGKVPNLQNKSIQQAINQYKTPNSKVEEEALFSVLKRMEYWNERMINKQMLFDGDVIQKSTNFFIKQQEYRKIAEFIIDKTKNGEIKSKYTITHIEEKFHKIAYIGEEEDDCEEVIENIDSALRKEFRQTIATGVEVIDALTGGGLGKGEIGLILTPSGVGKTTLLTKIANTAYEDGKFVAQIIFEDTKDQIKRKHYTIWSGIAQSEIDDNLDKVRKEVQDKIIQINGEGKLIIKKFSQENTTMIDIRNWMLGYQKKYGIKFDILVLDYLDCLESHKKTPDRNEAELTIIKSFEALASDFNIPSWSAIQSNRSGFDSEYVEAHQSGGNIKRIQKSHFFMSVAKTPSQKEASLANIRIIKARFAKDGQTFNDCIFNNDTMEIRIEDDRYKIAKMNKGKKHHNSDDIDKMETNLGKIHAVISQHSETTSIEKANDDAVNDAARDAVFDNLREKAIAEKNDNNSVIENEVDDKNIENVQLNINDIDGNNQKSEIIVVENILYKVDDEPNGNNRTYDYASNNIVEISKIGEMIHDINVKQEVKNIINETIKIQPSNNMSIIDIENTLIDPDEPQNEYKTVYEILNKNREKQHVIKT